MAGTLGISRYVTKSVPDIGLISWNECVLPGTYGPEPHIHLVMDRKN